MSDQKFKADSGKSDPTLFEEGFPNAVAFVQATLDYGAKKYEAHSWRKVPNGFERYKKAASRHRRDRIKEQASYRVFDDNPDLGFLSQDEESGLPHIAHELFNLMAAIELYIQAHPEIDFKKVLEYKEPPTTHKEITAAINMTREIFTSQTTADRERDSMYTETDKWGKALGH